MQAVVWFDFCLLSSSSFQHWSEFGAIWYSILEVNHACDGKEEEEKRSRYSFFLSLSLSPLESPDSFDRPASLRSGHGSVALVEDF